ncbi:hypothetical protein D5086_023662 [Populus alba]|uniref:Uncharacterized protein n=1 Tax=Populus alba TaxID=43335 RepID=A0ACC4BB36_POPAL
MIEAGVKPDGISILGVLVGCSHSGLVDEARKLFDEMESVYGVPREPKHYGCMADLLGRAGLIKKVMEMIKDMPRGGDMSVWSGLLGGCRIHGDVEIAEKAAKHLMELKPDDGGVYSILANVYANAERWEDVMNIRRSLSSNRVVTKIAGFSLIQLDGVAHEFIAGDSLHSERLLEMDAKWLRGNAHATSTSPERQVYAGPAVDFGYLDLVEEGRKMLLLYAPNVRFNKKLRETIPEVVVPDKVGYWKSIASRLSGTATYATSTPPKLKSYLPTADQFGHHYHQESKHGKKVRGDFVPVYVAIGMIAVSISLGLYTAKQQVLYAPNVRVRKKTRETIPEVVDPDKVVEEADKFIKKSFFRKVAHVQEFDHNGLEYLPDPVRKDVFAHKPRAETLKDVGVDPKLQL